MQPFEDAAPPVSDHGGNVAAARQRFPDAAQPWLDLSTGISPFPYPYSAPPATAFSRLPEPGEDMRLREIAASTYEANGAGNLVAAPGTQMLLPFVFALRKPGRAAVLGPTYAEHARVARLCGHDCHETENLDDLVGANLAVVVNPNNPDGRIVPRTDLLGLANRLAARGGMLVVDEAFMDVGPDATSLADAVDGLPIVVLRSFGKFYGLAGLRLGFAIAGLRLAETLRARLGPWSVSGPALAVGAEALADSEWRRHAVGRLAGAAAARRMLLEAVGLETVGGTSLFHLVRHADAAGLFDTLGRHGILVRAFEARPDLLRLGLSGNAADEARLADALALWSGR